MCVCSFLVQCTQLAISVTSSSSSCSPMTTTTAAVTSTSECSHRKRLGKRLQKAKLQCSNTLQDTGTEATEEATAAEAAATVPVTHFQPLLLPTRPAASALHTPQSIHLATKSHWLASGDSGRPSRQFRHHHHHHNHHWRDCYRSERRRQRGRESAQLGRQWERESERVTETETVSESG